MSYMEMVKQNQKENGFGSEGCCSFVVEVVDDLVFSIFCGGGVAVCTCFQFHCCLAPCTIFTPKGLLFEPYPENRS